MKTLIKKEIRLLLPAWITAMLMAIVPRVFIILYDSPGDPTYYQYSLPFINELIFAIGLLFLGIHSFGQELSSNTFSALLSQPMNRPRMWRVKVGTLATAFISVWLTAILFALLRWIVYRSHFQQNPRPDFSDSIEFFTLTALVAFSGGLWSTLLLRQITGAFWIALLAPASILAGLGILGDFLNVSESLENLICKLAILIYSAAGFLFARRMFLHAQDIQWTGGNLSFWRRKKVEQASSFVPAPIRNRFLALVWKEFRLHEAILFIAAILIVLNVGAVTLRPHVSSTDLKGALEFVWALWLLMPLLIGSATVAEERRLGVAESQLCQPVSRRVALCFKFLIGLILSVILGAVIPSLIEWTRNFGITNWTNFWIFIATPVIFFISFYASTLSRSTLQAIGIATAVSAGFLAFVMAACQVGFRLSLFFSPTDYASTGIGRLMMWLGLPIFPLVLVRLIFWNFKWLHSGWRLFRFNLAAILISFAAVFILANLIFYRTWELALPSETLRGPARLLPQSPAKYSLCPSDSRLNTMYALLPDGRLWQEKVDAPLFGLERWNPKLDTHRFIDSNWVEASAGGSLILGIRRNGSLWAVPEIGTGVPVTQIGSDTNWSNVARDWNRFLLLKKDGTLWLWGTNEDEHAGLSNNIKLNLATQPVRIDPGTNWTNIVRLSSGALAQKNDGTYWNWAQETSPDGIFISRLVQETNLDNQWISYLPQYEFSVELKTNGQLWLLYQRDTNWESSTWHLQRVPHFNKKIQLGSDSDWKTVTFGGSGSVILLRKDGTLWKWTEPWKKGSHPFQLGRQSDWVGLGTGMAIALAADGSLWSWDDPSDTVWLAPSRKPVYMGNIFEANGDSGPRSSPRIHE